MFTSVFNCHDNVLTDEVFRVCGKLLGNYFEDWHPSKKANSVLAELGCSAEINCYTKFDIKGEPKMEVDRRVVILFNPTEGTLDIYELFPHDILSELRLEFILRKNKGHFLVFKGLRNDQGDIHFYRKSEYGQPSVSRYFGVPSPKV